MTPLRFAEPQGAGHWFHLEPMRHQARTRLLFSGPSTQPQILLLTLFPAGFIQKGDDRPGKTCSSHGFKAASLFGPFFIFIPTESCPVLVSAYQ